ncbi:MAG: hypothetical protein M3R24_15985 [Chloroflexota bacterium]|nr:hypothetical protein [Chloroflexota bacterium]
MWAGLATGAASRPGPAQRLAMPQPLQVNIGGQQVNVAGGLSGHQQV